MNAMNKEKEIEKINKCINELVYDKVQLRKAYNYYHCTRDEEQFRHIEDNYGIGTPTSVGFTPLIKKHVDVLVGEYLELDPDLQITCKDEKTISNIMRDKQLKIHEAAYKYFEKQLNNVLLQVFGDGKEPVVDALFEQELAQIKKDTERSYVSEYEIAAQNILNYIKNSRDIDLKNKMRDLLTDLLIGGMCYYRTRPKGETIGLEILNPLDTFVERNFNEFYLNKSPRAVVRKWMTAERILDEYGKELSKEAKEKLETHQDQGVRNDNFIYVKTDMAPFSAMASTPGILGGMEAHPIRENRGAAVIAKENTYEVYECEWIEYDKEKERLTRHEGVKIGTEIYIVRGESENITRSISNPNDCSLSINGIFFSDKNGDPFSILLSTMDLQDRYDLTIYYRDSLIASSGTIGDFLDAAHLPEFLGEEMPERVQKWLAYKKQGVAWIDSSMEGSQMINTAFNGYDDTIKAQTIQAFQMVLESIEQQASSITGVFAEKLGGIQQRDAVSNVKVGIRQSTLLTKQYFSAMDLIYKEVNYDLLNLAKIVFKKGIAGTLINGTRLNQIFTALPEYYTMTDFDIHIQDSTEAFQMRETLKAYCAELIKAGLANAELIVDMSAAKNLTELKMVVKDALEKQKAETGQMQQLQQQATQAEQTVKEYEKQIKQMQEQMQQMEKQLEKMNEEKLALERDRLELDKKIAADKHSYDMRVAEIKEQQAQAEIAQLYDGNPYNDKIKEV